MSTRPLVLGHRGASKAAPENTIAAFELARAMGADGVELDVRRTADEVLVVHHDSQIEHLGTVSDVPFEVLRTERPDIPRLDEALDVLTGLVVNIELKCAPWEPDADRDHSLGETVAALARSRGIQDDVIVSSFDLEAVNAARAADPAMRTGWLVQGLDLADCAELVRELGHPYLNPDVGMVTGADDPVAEVIDSGVALAVWTVNDRDVIARLADQRVSAIITDEPDVAVEVLGARDGQGSTRLKASGS